MSVPPLDSVAMKGITMQTATRTFSTADVELAGGRVLRVGLMRGPDGAPEDLTLCWGWGAGGEWRGDERSSLILPAEALAGLRDALQQLERAGAP